MGLTISAGQGFSLLLNLLISFVSLNSINLYSKRALNDSLNYLRQSISEVTFSTFGTDLYNKI